MTENENVRERIPCQLPGHAGCEWLIVDGEWWFDHHPAPAHVPYHGEPFDPVHAHDWADGVCQSPDCMARLDGTTQPVSPAPVRDEWCREEDCQYRHWRSGSVPTHRRGEGCPLPVTEEEQA